MSVNAQEGPGGSRAWLIWSLAALSFGYAFFQRVAPSVMVSDLMGEFAIGGALLGVLSALYFYPYVLLQVPLGALLDRIGARKILTGALLLAAVGSALFASAQSVEMAYLGRLLVGAGSSVGFLGSLALAAKWFPQRKFSMLAGLSMFVAMTSGMVAQAPLALFVDRFGWRASMWTLGVVAIVLAAMIYAFVRDTPHVQHPTNIKAKTPWSEVWANLWQAMKHREVWKIATVAACMSGPMLALGALWGTPYLATTYGLERSEAAFYVSFTLFGWAIGAPTAGWLSNLINRQKSLIVIAAGVLSLALAILTFLPSLPLILTTALLFLTGLSGGAMAVTFSLVRLNFSASLAGSASGIVNSMTVASGAVLQPLVGLVLDRLWNGTLEAGSRVYEPSDFRTAFILIFACALIGFMVSVFLKAPVSE